jgi:hypothetical protein
VYIARFDHPVRLSLRRSGVAGQKKIKKKKVQKNMKKFNSRGLGFAANGPRMECEGFVVG